MPHECKAQSASPPAEQPQDALAGISAQSSANPHAYSYLEELADGIGARLTGSEQAARSSRWALNKMQSIGLQNVHLEGWALHQSWQRGHAHAELLSPISRPLTVTSLGWSGSVQRARGADLIAVDRDATPQQLQAASAQWKGKVLFLISRPDARRDDVVTLARLGPLVDSAIAASALAVITGDDNIEGAGMALRHTGPVSFLPRTYSIPVLDMVREDRKQIERFLQQGKRVRVQLDVQNTISRGAVQAENVVGEIPGTEDAEEIVLVGAHLDSWDLAQGATDDGVGVVSVLAAAKAMIDSHSKPRRTVRFVLFSGEEQGLLGSRAYVKQHEQELNRHVCALIIDLGQGRITGIQLAGHDELRPVWMAFAEQVKHVASLEVNNLQVLFTDAYPFTLAGLPGITFAQLSPDYGAIHHSNADTLDKVDATVLAYDAELVALSSFWIADYPLRVPGRWSKEKVVEMLTTHKQQGLLESLGLWPVN
jgi:carboxypeptidase Q